jgi:hypothetical protein
MFRQLAAVALVLCLCGGIPVGAVAQSNGGTQSVEPWQREFDEICGPTHDAMTFTPDELASLIARCDALLPKLQKLDDTRRKVFTNRLQMCRGLYAYVLESKKSEKK